MFRMISNFSCSFHDTRWTWAFFLAAHDVISFINCTQHILSQCPGLPTLVCSNSLFLVWEGLCRPLSHDWLPFFGSPVSLIYHFCSLIVIASPCSQTTIAGRALLYILLLFVLTWSSRSPSYAYTSLHPCHILHIQSSTQLWKTSTMLRPFSPEWNF